MAGEAEIVSQLLGGGGSNDILGFQRTLAGNDLFSQVGDGLLGAKFNTSTWSPAESLATSAVQAFLGAALRGYGQYNQGKQLEKVAAVLPQLYADPASVSLPEGVDPAAFGQLKMGTMQRRNALTEAQRVGDQSDREKLFTEVFSRNPAIAMKTMPDIAQRMGVDIPSESPSPSERDPGPINPLASGKSSTEEKFKQYYRSFLAEGMPAQQAATAAKEQVKGEVAANAKSFDQAQEARKYGQKLLELSSQAKSAIGQAGETGNFQGIRHGLDVLGANILGLEDSKKKVVADTVLDGLAPQIIQLGRSPGAVSDFEAAMLLKSGPSTGNRPEANAILAQKWEDLGKLSVDYADFLEAYREANAGSIIGADKKWDEYRKAFPLFKGEGESIQLNSDRPSWQDFFSGEAVPQQSGKNESANGNTNDKPVPTGRYTKSGKPTYIINGVEGVIE